jgi:hypothetical protein
MVNNCYLSRANRDIEVITITSSYPYRLISMVQEIALSSANKKIMATGSHPDRFVPEGRKNAV